MENSGIFHCSLIMVIINSYFLLLVYTWKDKYSCKFLLEDLSLSSANVKHQYLHLVKKKKPFILLG